NSCSTSCRASHRIALHRRFPVYCQPSASPFHLPSPPHPPSPSTAPRSRRHTLSTRDLPPAPPKTKDTQSPPHTRTAAQGALASLAPSSLSPALSVTVAATTSCPLLSTAQHSTASLQALLLALLCFASLQQKQGERRGAAKPESRFTANATHNRNHSPRTTYCHPTTLCPVVTFQSLLSRDANSRPDLSLPLQSAPIDDTTSDQLIPIENTILFLYPPSPTITLFSP
ncbi:hypothetical protein CNYM01_00376, partial [Colletotrichum nymphaeae SA-01]